MPRYAALDRLAPRLGLSTCATHCPALAKAMEDLTGFTAKRTLPAGGSSAFRESGPFGTDEGRPRGRAVRRHVQPLFRAGEPTRPLLERSDRAAVRACMLAGRTAARPLCCGRTYLAAGLVDRGAQGSHAVARSAVKPHVAASRGVPIVGLEPSCLFTLSDEFPPCCRARTASRLAEHAVLLEEFI